MSVITRTTEDDASPETRFIRHTPSGSVELPNDRWMRSPKIRDYAICLDPENRHAGWLLLEGWGNNWVPVRALSLFDLEKLRDLPGTNGAHRALLIAHLQRIDRG
jgi:hypothetical protein